MITTRVSSVEDYISGFPDGMQSLLQQVRTVIKEAAPEAEEGIGYGMASYKLRGRPVVYFAGFKHHVGLYATPSGHSAFAEELSKYKQGKGSVQFPLDQPIDFELISKIVKFRVAESEEKIKMKSKK